MLPVTRRSWLRLAGLGSAAAATLFGARRLSGGAEPVLTRRNGARRARDGSGRARFDRGIQSRAFLRAWNFSDLPAEERARYYKETPRPDGTLLREYRNRRRRSRDRDRARRVLPGLDVQRSGARPDHPRDGRRSLRITFVNAGSHPHTMHFHGWHPPEMDGSMPEHQVMPGGRFVYEFDAEPFGMHLYHCHAVPLKRHIHKGLYGVFIVDPRHGASGSRRARHGDERLRHELRRRQRGLRRQHGRQPLHDTSPIKVEVGKLVRMYLVNVTEFDLINSLHLHGMFFDVFRTGTRTTSSESTDTVMLCQGERAVLETRFRYPGKFMFHAHQSEFAELGWMGTLRSRGSRAVTPEGRRHPRDGRASWAVALVPLAAARRAHLAHHPDRTGRTAAGRRRRRQSSGWRSSARC